MEKTNNCLVWFDNGPYTYLNYAICLSLDKIKKYNFVGIAATKPDYNFLSNQEQIHFKELYHYPTCYINKTSYNLNQIIHFEKRYDLNLWLNIYGERMFHKHRTHFHKFSKFEILTIIENTIKFFVEVLEKTKPEFIIMQTAGENVANTLLYEIAKSLNIKTLMINFTHIHNHVVVSDNLISKEISNEFQEKIKNNSSIDKQYSEALAKSLGLSETVKVMSTFNFDNVSQTQKIKRYLKRITNEPEQLYQNVGKTKLQMLKWKIITYFEVRKRKKFLDNYSFTKINNEKFIYFPLHTEPEAKILATTPFFSNQFSTIENIARSIPIDYVLYVKEHPGQLMKLWRPIEYYKKIVELPNVKLIHPTVNSHDLISKCEAVISITGSTGFEALFYKKPVILFANEFYDSVSMVTKVEKLTNLPSIIKNAIETYQFRSNELDLLIQSIKESSIEIPYAEIMKDGLVVSSIQRTNNSKKQTSTSFLEFYNKHLYHFERLAQAFQEKAKLL